VVAQNIHAVTAGRAPAPFIYRTIGIMAAFGRMNAAADVRGFNITGFPAWWLRRSYYLFQMPRWDTRLRIVFDWTVALFFRSEPTELALTAQREQPSLNSPAGRKLRETPLQRDLWPEEQG
jgi:NADH dehydrogenase